jgi:predicted naringenin-chalcone synthase
MSLAILGLGTAVPAAAFDRAEGMEIARAVCCRTAEQATWLSSIYTQTGIRTRHSVLGRDVVFDVLHGTQTTRSVFLPTGAADDAGPTTAQRMEVYAAGAGPLALDAARLALRDARTLPGAVTHLITVSCTGFRAPGVDIELIRALDLAATTQRTHIGYMGCHGALNALRVARAFTAAEPDACVLVCAVELCSLHYQYKWDPQRIIGNAIFADGAAALVGIPNAAAPAGAWQVVSTGSCLIPDSADAMTWIMGDHGFEMTLSRRVPALIAQHLRGWLETWLGRHGLKLAEVASWAIHPGGPRIVGAVEESLGLPRARTAASWEVLADYGNMSSPTVLFILERLRRRQAPRPCVALGFGPGLVAEAALFV